MRNGNARDTVSNRQEIFSSSENYASSDAAPDDAVPPPVSPEDVDELLSKELQELSFQERSNILEEVHGVTCFAPNETPELLQNALQQMNFHLRHSVLHKPAFDLAQTFPKTYTNETEFRLKFLRAELFDAKKSAVRLVKFLELARELYGNQCLQRPVQLSDLGADGGEALRSGQWQLLPCRDRSGRRIFAMVNDMAFRFSLEARVSNLHEASGLSICQVICLCCSYHCSAKWPFIYIIVPWRMWNRNKKDSLSSRGRE
jgi:hypothetical protein